MRQAAPDGTTRAPRRILLLLVALGVDVAATLLVGWWPTRVDVGVTKPIHHALDRVHIAGGPTALTSYDVIEFTANIAFFVPFGVLAALLLPRTRWWIAVAAGVVLSSVIELGQLLFRPERTASVLDVLANSSGALAGALLVRLLGRRPERRPS